MNSALACVAIAAALAATGSMTSQATDTTAADATASTAAADAGDALRIDFDYLNGPDGEPVTEIQVNGTAGATGSIATLAGGELLIASARPPHGRAVSYPSFDPDPDGPRAVISVLDETGRDDLSPKKRDFSFGADFVLDAVSSEPGSADDGDNLLQRGLYDDPAQYKLQVDARHPSCRVKGTAKGAASEVDVTSRVEVDDTHWYRAACSRDGRRLKIVVTAFGDDGTSVKTKDTASSDKVIKVAMNPRTVPLSIGGKLYADGSVDTDSDQFNGLVDEAYYSLD